MAETSLLYKEVRRVSVECCFVKPDWCGLRSELEFLPTFFVNGTGARYAGYGCFDYPSKSRIHCAHISIRIFLFRPRRIMNDVIGRSKLVYLTVVFYSAS